MRLVSNIELEPITADLPDTLTASDTIYSNYYDLYYYGQTAYVTRAEAMSVPAIARARNILCATAGTLGLYRYNEMTGQKITNTPLLYQPDPNSPAFATWTWVYDSLYFYGKAYLEVLDVYQEDLRPRQARWIDPQRITPNLNSDQTMIDGYYLDGKLTPSEGVGSILYIPGADEGILARGANTIATAIALENAAKNAAQEPTPQTVLKSTGVDLPTEKITDLLTKWKQTRKTRATAYLYSGLEMQTVGFDPKSQQLVEARQYMAAEIARLSNIPAWYLGAETNSMTYSNVESERRALAELSLIPYLLRPLESRLSMLDITPRGVVVRADLREFTRANALERIEVIAKMLELGLITVEEARAMEDLAPGGQR